MINATLIFIYVNILLLICVKIDAYKLSASYNYTNFFNNFVFEAVPDPTHGTVQYVDKVTALSSGLASYTANKKVYLGVGPY